ncbi:MAG: hypothetical protein JXR34_10850 [Bacteroidales bacterium]|nr:hypothetical protein [Bacteroidales bacterium]
MAKLQIIIIVVLFGLLPPKLTASLYFNAPLTKAYSQIMEMNLSGARTITKAELIKNPDNQLPIYIETYALFIEIAINQNEEKYDAFLEKSDLLLSKLEKEKETPLKRYFMADIYMLRAAIKGLDNSYFSALLEVRNAYQNSTENLKKYPNFTPQLKMAGLLNIVFGSVPEKYSWMLQMVGLKGSIKKGFEQLAHLQAEVLAGKYSWLTTESLVIYQFCQLNYGNTQEYLKSLSPKLLHLQDSLAKTNSIVCYSAVSLYRHKGDNEKIIHLLEDFKPPKNYQKFYFLDFLAGEAYLYRMDNKSITYFNRYLQEFKGTHYRKSALQRMGWYYLIFDNHLKFLEYNKRILTEGNDLLDSDKKALKSTKQGEKPNKYLLKCRLLFDGGYYREAEAVFLVHNPRAVLKTDKEFLEYQYRMGRLYDEWNKDEKAIEFYLKTIETGRNDPSYFAANSALHLGMLYENRNELEKAKRMYSMVLDLDFDEYHNSITQKARAGLNRLEN